jgi:hypothetical protein
MGPGVLAVGSAGSSIDFSARVTSAKVVPKVDAEDDVLTLAGTTESGDRTYTYTLDATVYQDDLRDGELVEFTWLNAGAVLPVTFTPFAGGKSVTGDVLIDPMEIGGDVGKKNQSDIKWAFIGAAELVDDLA